MMWFGNKTQDLTSQIKSLPNEIQSSVALCSLDAQGHIIATTDLMASYLQSRTDKLSGVSLLDKLESQIETGWLAMTRKLPASFEVSRNSASYQLDISSDPLKGHYLGVLTRKTDAEEKQDDSLEDAVNACFGVAHYAPDGTLISANRGFEQVVGRDTQSHHCNFVAFSSQSQQEAMSKLWASLIPGEAHQDLLQWQTPDGKRIWVQSNLIPDVDDNLNIVRVRQFISDMTQMVESQQEAGWQLGAISQSQAVIEFDTQGNILTANSNFLSAMGYQLTEIQGQHHRIFMPAEDAATPDYQNFWPSLAKGQYFSGEFRRKDSQGKDVWIQASYNPIKNDDGQVVKVIKFAADITEQKQKNVDYQGKIDAINRSQAVIEFTPEGLILTANDNFLGAMGYSMEQIKGKHHRTFMPAEATSSHEYQKFWENLANGSFQQGEFRRVNSRGQDIWIQASYNPILDNQGRVVKVVKFATDITAQKLKNADFEGQIKAIGRSQAVIEFTPDGTILDANDNFLAALSYRLDEIKGKHHRTFVSEAERSSDEYKQFWADLGKGKFASGEFMRVDKQGNEIWIQASYNPILDNHGQVLKVVKYASDITAQKQAVKSIMHSVMAMSRGDLTCKLPTNLEGEFGKLAISMNTLLDELSTMVTQIREASENVMQASGEITQANTDLSQRTEAQAAGLQQTAAAMESLTKLVSGNAGQASDATRESDEIAKRAKDGQQVVGNTIQAMDNIQSSSKSIADIIAVIDEIAFQTNLLALNASVEAARAGELGRGFAVVAAEVRNLAQRSANSAKEIKELINKSVDAVDNGSVLVARSGETFAQLVAAVENITAMVNNIDKGSQEQAKGINEINTAVSNMDSMVQQNVSMVEQASVASQSLKEQAQSLLERVAFFKTASPSQLSGTGNTVPLRRSGS